ncbi:hypothetical protein [Clostridium tetani]|uniref:Uncharacterized protein n=1 Tax=Clostridium tetani TaxID=1513 RepID=A0ABY0EQE9_CLOTA|nr:hypothetical protein [Clostridium tetani]CDI48743.1 hypothetical protein BN906_00720 [Clostridium tetani 12124569]KHO39916.1 hypothetical protein OR62_03450 [Clostridium tetani]RXI41803.1 hypothetical protein DP129_00835 [Clostridium tetani]RXI57119.1 hypothetical protein DP131_05995 [Clostridium tetani]RXI67205.1 hypothetical protein DQN76_12015 [Clostridium tetani]
MNNTENIYTKIFIKSIIFSVCLVLSNFVVYSFSEKSSPNLLTMGYMAFVVFYAGSLIIYKIKKKFGKNK